MSTHRQLDSSAAYTATYDLAGNLVCRAPTNATTCAGPSPTGAQLRYDAEERLASWQNAPSNPTTTASYLYDGAGERVAQAVTSGGTTTTTAYLGGNEEVATTGSSTTTTTYYSVAGRLIALAVNGVFTYLAGDGLGSVSAAFDANGNPQASALYRPYGSLRYSSGTMPGSFGFTGQRNDTAVTGLNYDHARYYDPAAGVFTTADNLPLTAKGVGQGQTRELLNRYAYVGGDPETRTDPTGHMQCQDGEPACGTTLGNGSPSHTTPSLDSGTCNRGGCYEGSKRDANLVHCNGTAAECQAIDQAFQDPRTREILYLLLYSSEGRLFLPFLLKEGSLYGDSYITWTDGSGGNNDPAGMIQLGTGLLTKFGGDLISNLINGANALIHEAVESFYADAYGIRTQASVHMDYVAQWFAGETSQQLNDVFGSSNFLNTQSSYQESFGSWEQDPNGGKGYKDPVNQGGLGEPETQWEVQHPVARFLAQSAVPGGWPDEMGLNLQMLSSNYV